MGPAPAPSPAMHRMHDLGQLKALSGIHSTWGAETSSHEVSLQQNKPGI